MTTEDLARQIAEESPSEQQIHLLKLGASAAYLKGQLDSSIITVNELREFFLWAAAAEAERVKRDSRLYGFIGHARLLILSDEGMPPITAIRDAIVDLDEALRLMGGGDGD